MPGAVALLKSTPRVTRSEKRRPAGSQAVRACDKRHKPRHKPLPPVKAVADEVHTVSRCMYALLRATERACTLSARLV